MYKLDIAHIEHTLIRQKPIPDCVLNKPKLHIGLSIYLDAFFDLDSERSIGMVQGRIPWSKIVMYAQYNSFDEEQSDNLIYFIKKMDTAYLKRSEKKNANTS